MTNESEDARHSEEQPRIVIRDKRRIDPQTGEIRRPDPDPAATVPSAEKPGAAPENPADSTAPPTEQQLVDIDRLTGELAERTNDLQRVNAEYANYRKRSDRERETIMEIAKGSLISELIPVLDDIDRADEHGDLGGGFKNVADSLRAVLAKAGLEPFGAQGDAFDPMIHEAVAHNTAADVEVESVSAVMRKGYRQGERILRPAMVAVVAPA
ncbi:MAG: nucleotide exchange factor GrpE [Antricoccus sp.]